MKILIMGLPGSGKTWLAERLVKEIPNCFWINADVVRNEANDWDFSPEGRMRQAHRMRIFADAMVRSGKNVICDFVAPTEELRKVFDADRIIWMDTIQKSKYEDTNKLFEQPKYIDLCFMHRIAEETVKSIATDITKQFTWNNPTVQMLGRFQPWHAGHTALFQRCHNKTGQVIIQVRDVQGVGDNPFDFETVCKNIEDALIEYCYKRGKEYEIMLVPNITNITYGRDVGYSIDEEWIDDKTHEISATEIRKEMREKGELDG
jgi:adenylate kinase family enzyme